MYVNGILQLQLQYTHNAPTRPTLSIASCCRWLFLRLPTCVAADVAQLMHLKCPRGRILLLVYVTRRMMSGCERASGPNCCCVSARGVFSSIEGNKRGGSCHANNYMRHIPRPVDVVARTDALFMRQTHSVSGLIFLPAIRFAYKLPQLASSCT